LVPKTVDSPQLRDVEPRDFAGVAETACVQRPPAEDAGIQRQRWDVAQLLLEVRWRHGSAPGECPKKAKGHGSTETPPGSGILGACDGDEPCDGGEDAKGNCGKEFDPLRAGHPLVRVVPAGGTAPAPSMAERKKGNEEEMADIKGPEQQCHAHAVAAQTVIVPVGNTLRSEAVMAVHKQHVDVQRLVREQPAVWKLA
jgi:hypothetical protein